MSQTSVPRPAATRAALIALSGGDTRVNRILLLLLSGILTLFFFFSAEYYFAGGAGSFLLYAKAVAFGEKTIGLVQRDIGYPLLLVLTGFPFTDSLKGVVVAQALMGFAIPTMVYAAVGESRPRIALVAALTCIVSLVPYQFIKMFYHDQLYVFLTMLAALAFLQYMRSGKVFYLYALALTLAATGVTRPAGNLLFVTIMILVWALQRRHTRHHVVCWLLFAALTWGNYEHRRYALDLRPGEPMPSYTGHQVFYNFYVNSREFGITLTPAMGPAVKRLTEEIRKEFGPVPAQHPGLLAYRGLDVKYFETSLAFDSVDPFVQRVFERPSGEYFLLLHAMPAVAFDSALFLQASWEVARSHPAYFAQFTLRNLWQYLFVPGYVHLRISDTIVQGRNNPEYYPLIGGIAVEPGLPEKTLKEISQVPVWSHAAGAVKDLWARHYGILNTAVACLSTAGFIAAVLALVAPRRFRGGADRQWPILLFVCFTIVIYNGLMTAAFAEPLYRYHYMTMPVEIVCAALTLCVLADFLASKMHVRSARSMGASAP